MNKIIFHILIFSFLFYFAFSTICRDGSVCPGNSTCCLTPHGVGCCPYYNAVCCGDGFHCCPQNYICGIDTCYIRSATGNSGNDFFNSNVEVALLIQNPLKTKEIPTIHNEIQYIIENCIQDKFIEFPFKEMFTQCEEKEKDYEKSQSCKFSLLYLINEGFIRSLNCYNRIDSLIKRL